MELLKGLNPQQHQAITVPGGATLVMAGPGSGKTRVLTHRIAYLLGTLGVRPFHVLAVTFTNKAAREMEHRVESMLGQETHGLTLGTFHGVCARWLRRETDHLPVDKNFVIFDADDQMQLVKTIIRELNLDEKSYRPQSIHGSISKAKNELIHPDEFSLLTYRDEIVQRVYQQYQNKLIKNNAVDFDDLLMYTARLLEDNPEVRQRYARRFEHVLVDEFQDTNMAQYTLLKHLASYHRNIFVVGDIDQSIYRWRGADYRNVHRFEQDFPNAQVILLEQNYRSTQNILNIAMAVIDQNPNRIPKKLFTARGTGIKVFMHEAYDSHQEAQFVIDTIAAETARANFTPGDFAVMYRTNAQSRLVEEAFLRVGLPYKLVGAQRFYGRREIKDMVAYLRLVHNPADEVSLGRAINTPPRRIGNKSIELMRAKADGAGLSPGGLLLELAKGESSPYADSIPSRSAVPLTSFAELLAGWVAYAADNSPLNLLDKILDDINYEEYIDDGGDEGASRWENIGELRRLAVEFEGRGLSAFLEDVALVSDQDTLVTEGDAPTLLTLHASKGLEFPAVFIIGLVDGTLPHSRSMEEKDGMDEERRLLYVGITRAKDRVCLTYPGNQSTYGYSEPSSPSRFLLDIPDEMVTWVNGYGGEASHRKAEKQELRWENFSAASKKPADQSSYRPGMRVRHDTWGDGMVLNSKIQDGDETVEIFFEKVGLKKVATSFAKLTKVT